MHKDSQLSIEHHGEFDGDLQIGFTKAEMVDRVEALLKSMGFVKDFAPLIYVVSHGSSSVNNPAASACALFSIMLPFAVLLRLRSWP